MITIRGVTENKVSRYSFKEVMYCSFEMAACFKKAIMDSTWTLDLWCPYKVPKLIDLPLNKQKCFYLAPQILGLTKALSFITQDN